MPRPRHTGGLVNTGYSSRPSSCDSSTSDSALPMTPGSRRATASTMARTATSPPLRT